MIMSEKKLLSIFMEKMATDEAFVAKVAGLQTPEELIELAKELGVELSEEQAKKGLAHVQKLVVEDSVIDEDTLENIAGGACGACWNTESQKEKC